MAASSISHSYRRNALVYGFAVHSVIGHYCFNRNYEVLPVQLPDQALAALKVKAVATCRDSSVVMRDFLSAHSLPLHGWVTYWLFNDGTRQVNSYQKTELDRLFATSEVC